MGPGNSTSRRLCKLRARVGDHLSGFEPDIQIFDITGIVDLDVATTAGVALDFDWKHAFQVLWF
jgi:hypothetical protein